MAIWALAKKALSTAKSLRGDGGGGDSYEQYLVRQTPVSVRSLSGDNTVPIVSPARASIGPTGSQGLPRRLVRTIVGDVAGERANPNFNPEVDNGELPYQKAGFFRSILGDTSNEANAAYANDLRQAALKRRYDTEMENMRHSNAMDVARFNLGAQIAAEADARQRAADEQNARIALAQNQAELQARLAQQEAAQRAQEAAANRQFLTQRDAQQIAAEKELARQSAVGKMMGEVGYSPSWAGDPIMESMASERAQQRYTEDEARRAELANAEIAYRSALTKGLGRTTLAPGQFSYEEGEPFGIYNAPEITPSTGGGIIPSGPRKVPVPGRRELSPDILSSRPPRTSQNKVDVAPPTASTGEGGDSNASNVVPPTPDNGRQVPGEAKEPLNLNIGGFPISKTLRSAKSTYGKLRQSLGF